LPSTATRRIPWTKGSTPQLAEFMRRCERLGIKVRMMQHNPTDAEMDRIEMRNIFAPLEVLAEWIAKVVMKFFAAYQVLDLLLKHRLVNQILRDTQASSLSQLLRPAARRLEAHARGAGEGGGVGEPRADSTLLAYRAGDFAGAESGLGREVVERWRDLAAEFPEISGFSRANLLRMRSFYVAYALPKFSRRL
jgi:hypothetical protein